MSILLETISSAYVKVKERRLSCSREFAVLLSKYLDITFLWQAHGHMYQVLPLGGFAGFVSFIFVPQKLQIKLENILTNQRSLLRH